VDANERTLLKLAIHDDAYLESVLALGLGSTSASGLDARVQALARVGALVAVDAAPAAYLAAIEPGLAAGTTREDVVGVLVALLPSVGCDRVVAAAPRLALALGHDVDELLERTSPSET
jgi:4-carboxymuconolactone decarboxylase